MIACVCLRHARTLLRLERPMRLAMIMTLILGMPWRNSCRGVSACLAYGAVVSFRCSGVWRNCTHAGYALEVVVSGLPQAYTDVCEKNTPPDKKTGWKISPENTKSGAGLQFLLLGRRATALVKG